MMPRILAFSILIMMIAPVSIFAWGIAAPSAYFSRAMKRVWRKLPAAIFMAALLSLIATNPVTAAGGETAALTGTLSDGATVAQIVAGSETAILTLTGTTWTTGDNAGQFTSANTEYLTVADNASLSANSSPYSLAAWVLMDDKSSNRTIVSKWETAGNDREFVVQYSTSTDSFQIVMDDDGGSGDSRTQNASTFGSPTTGIWQFVIASYSGTITDLLKMQVNNGTVDELLLLSFGGLSNQDGDFSIGAFDSGTNPWDGGIAAVGFWEKDLSTAERTSLYNSGAGLFYSQLSGSLLTDLISYWDLEEASGTRFDSHSNNNDLTDNNTVTTVASPVGPNSFAGQRQDIIDGMVSNLDDANGWNVRRADFPVTDVVRTSDTVATITLSASSAYTIPAAETVTITLPASILAISHDIIATPSFTIGTAFVSSGNRVSTAINLSSVTDVAFCSLAWEATLPTDTTLTVDTSVNGGTSYTLGHANGSCPEGISLGSSLASITDFRIRVNLATTDSSVTPLVNTLALVIEDTSGQDLYYQLNTTPTVSLTDRSANSFVGTMSFPVGSSTINATTDPIETSRTARDPLPIIVAQGIPEVVSAVTGSATADNLFNLDETGFAALPLQGLVTSMSNAGDGLPIRFVWFIFIGFFIVGAGVIAMKLTGMLVMGIIVMGIGLGIWTMIGSGMIPGWIIFAYIPVGVSFVLLRKGFPA